MDRFNFGPAQLGEPMVFGAQRPGYNDKSVQQGAVAEWITFMQRRGIQRVCCLLPAEQLGYYEGDLLAAYRQEFGVEHVCHVGIPDYHLCTLADLNNKILPFLSESDDNQMPVVVHSSGGSGRTGHVLAAWLVRRRGLSVEAAIHAVCLAGRNPNEAVDRGNAIKATLTALLLGTER